MKIKNIIIGCFLLTLFSCGKNSGNAPSLASTGSTAAKPCSGASVGGYCWYLAANLASCDTACATHGGYDSATASYAGSSGSDANCSAVLTALAAAGGPSTTGTSCAAGYGCNVDIFSNWIRCTTPATGSSLLVNGLRRACACYN